jgi:hypothetical protein
MKNLKHIFICSLIVMLFACASTGKQSKRPDWVDGESRKYSDNSYLIGRGVSSNLDDAKDRARVDIAKVFEVALIEYGKDKQEYQQLTQDGESEVNSSQHVIRVIRTQTKKVVEGVEIPEIWQDEQGQYYALAVLNRKQARKRLKDEIKRLDEATNIVMGRVIASSDRLAEIARLTQAMELQNERAVALSSLQIVNPSGKGVAVVWNVTKLERRLAEVMGAIFIYPQLLNEDHKPLLTILASAITEAGFKSTEINPWHYMLAVDLTLEEPTVQNGWTWIRGTLEIILRTGDGNVIGNKRWPIKASSTQETLVYERLYNQAANTLNKELRGAIVGFVQ